MFAGMIQQRSNQPAHTLQEEACAENTCLFSPAKGSQNE